MEHPEFDEWGHSFPKVENIRYFKLEDSSFSLSHNPGDWIDKGRFKTVGDVWKYLLWLGEAGRHQTGYLKLTGYDDVEDGTLIGDKGKTQNDPFIIKKVRMGILR